MRFLSLLCLLFCIGSCKTQNSEVLSDASDQNVRPLIELYELENDLFRTEDMQRRYASHDKSDVLSIKEKSLFYNSRLAFLQNKKKQKLANPYFKKSFFDSNIPRYIPLKFSGLKRDFSQELTLNNFNLYQKRPDGSFRKYLIENTNVENYTINLIQHLQAPHPEPTPEELISGKQDKSPIFLKNSSIVCDGPYKLKASFKLKSRKAHQRVKFDWYRSDDSNGSRVKLVFLPNTSKCLLSFKDKGKEYGVEISSAVNHTSPAMEKFKNRFEYCEIPEYKGSKINELFLNTSFHSMTCPQEVEHVRGLAGVHDGLTAKAKALLGQDLPEEMFKTRNPYYELDFSKAPKLDAIYISALVFRRDFYGTVIERLLRFHAKRGTEIKIMVSKVITLSKDLVMLNDLDNEFPNVMVNHYKFKTFSVTGLNETLSPLHRTLHVKMFLTYSEKDESANTAIIGGRNIHDGFIFSTPTDFSKYPKLVQYGKDETFSKWTDFELEFKSKKFVESLMGQYRSVFEYDKKDFFFRDYTLNRRSHKKLSQDYFSSGKTFVRHLTSVPFKDNMALESFVVDYLDSAQKSIVLSTPYFNLTDKINKALERAINRGVDITLLTRLDLEGDTFSSIISDVNKTRVNAYYKKIKIYEYTSTRDILHSKLVLVDGEASLVGSINFNQRSFYHDLENTLFIKSPKIHDYLLSVIENYKKTSRLITEKQKSAFWKRVIIRTLKKEL